MGIHALGVQTASVALARCMVADVVLLVHETIMEIVKTVFRDDSFRSSIARVAAVEAQWRKTVGREA